MSTAGRRVLVTGMVLTVLALIGAGGAVAAGLLGGSTPDYRTAEVSRGDLSETVALAGSVTRINQASETFPTSGTVTWLGVRIGDRVTAGEPLARIERLPLQVELVKASAELTQARAAYHRDLKAADDAAKQKKAAKESNAPTSDAEASNSPPPQEPAPAPGGEPGGNGAPGGSSAAAALQQLLGRLTAEMAAAHRICAAVPQPGLTGSPTPTATPSPTATASSTPTATPSPTPTLTPTPGTTPTPTAPPTPSATPTPAPTANPTATPAPTPTATTSVDPITLQGCLRALSTVTTTQVAAAQALALASAELSAATEQLSVAAEAQAEAMADAAQQQAEEMARAQAEILSQATGGGQSGAGSVGSLKAQLARDLVAITRAQQAVDKARDDLADATLRAPITGVVGSIDFTQGSVASASSGITVVGSGASEVTVPVPLSLMGKVAVGQTAEVVPPGGTKPVQGEVTAISPLPGSSATGGDPTYETVISVRRSPVALTTGVSATVRITVARADDVLVLPMSATVPIDEKRASVRILTPAGGIEEVSVTTGVKDVSRIEIVRGLRLGQRVVIADPTKPLPGLDLFGSEEEPQPEEPAGASQEPATAEPTR